MCKRISRVMQILMIAGFCIAIIGSANAGELDNISIHGFAHQSFIKTDTNTFVVDNAEDGSFKDFTVGLTFTAKPANNVFIRAQIIENDNTIDLDWGFGEYHINENFGVKAGKMKLPFGLFTETMPVRALQPFNFLPGFYNFGVNTVNGFGGFANYEHENGWGGSFDLYGGYFPANIGGSLDDILGGQLWITPPIDGLKTGFGYVQSTLNIPLYGMAMNLKFCMLSCEYTGDKLFMRSEYSWATVDGDKDNQWLYAEAGYLVNEYIQPVVRWAKWEDLDWTSAPDPVGRPKLTKTETEIGMGVNVFMSNGVILKLEYHMFDGNSSLALSNQDPMDMKNPVPDEKWNLLSLSTAFMF